jgi:hypothetical protein
MMYGNAMLGSNQEALRLLKLLPLNGTEPSGRILNWNGGGPWPNLKTGRGSPGGAWIEAVAKYSSKFWFRPFVIRS